MEFRITNIDVKTGNRLALPDIVEINENLTDNINESTNVSNFRME